MHPPTPAAHTLARLVALATLVSAAATFVSGGYDPGLAAECDRAAREYADLSYPLNINEASKEELASIEGVTVRQAALIVEFREKVGVISDLRMLLGIRGIGEKTFARLERNTFVSFKDEPIRRPAPEPDRAAANAGAAADPAFRPNLNAANAEELAAVRGIGEKTALAILEQRDRMGGFRSFDDLLAVRGIGQKRVAALKERFSLGF